MGRPIGRVSSLLAGEGGTGADASGAGGSVKARDAEDVTEGCRCVGAGNWDRSFSCAVVVGSGFDTMAEERGRTDDVCRREKWLLEADARGVPPGLSKWAFSASLSEDVAVAALIRANDLRFA